MLIRMNSDLFAQLENEWRATCDAFGESFEEYAAHAIEHARSISAEHPADDRYGIFALKQDDAFACLLHANWARLPRTIGKTVRVLWVLLAPKYDFEDVKPQVVARITADLIVGALELAKTSMASAHVKIHIGNMLDRQYVTGIAALLTTQGVFTEAEVRGNWLHISM